MASSASILSSASSVLGNSFPQVTWPIQLEKPTHMTKASLDTEKYLIGKNRWQSNIFQPTISCKCSLEPIYPVSFIVPSSQTSHTQTSSQIHAPNNRHESWNPFCGQWMCILCTKTVIIIDGKLCDGYVILMGYTPVITVFTLYSYHCFLRYFAILACSRLWEASR